ncbi:uncharacterized protein LOC130900731 isoform X2 [Diorhabda carinulata]|uniref:uncharacterized protein LOC130900731 isoform X2 n=1 Tax=Diorhabda carinulata TaxID=1163345 RepID=UPI0025A21850|nr:uncharacterized protein LOC130900731 isoform X2 [Diorhabda carinulata]
MGDKPQKNPGIRLRRAASDWTHNRTTGTIRNDFRRNFLTRLKGNRSRSVDRFRLLVDNYGELISYRSVSDLRAVLAEDPEASRLMNDTEILPYSILFLSDMQLLIIYNFVSLKRATHDTTASYDLIASNEIEYNFITYVRCFNEILF